MHITNIKVEHRGTRYWVVLGDTERFGEQAILFEGITKKECLQYIAREKHLFNEATRLKQSQTLLESV